MTILLILRIIMMFISFLLVLAIIKNLSRDKIYFSINYFSWLTIIILTTIGREFIMFYFLGNYGYLKEFNLSLILSFLYLFEYSLLAAYFTKLRFDESFIFKDKLISGLVRAFIFLIPVTFLIVIGSSSIHETKIMLMNSMSYIHYSQIGNYSIVEIIINCLLAFIAVYLIVPYFISIRKYSNKENMFLILFYF